MKITRILLSLLFATLFIVQGYTLIPTDRKQRLTEHWEFIRQDMGSIWEVMRPVPGVGKPEAVPLWQTVTLPHCFNAEDAVDPDAGNFIEFGCTNSKALVQNQGTVQGSRRIQAANGLASICVNKVNGPCVVSASASLGERRVENCMLLRQKSPL